MKLVKSWAMYKENWADYLDAASSLIMEAFVASCVVFIIIPALFLVLLGFAPTEEGDCNGKD